MLVNVYQKNSEIVYTGVIQYLSSADLVMDTYSDYGLRDGEVYLKIAGIEKVETDSYDIASMKDRITFDEDSGIELDENAELPVNLSDNLFLNIINMLNAQENPALIVTLNNEKLEYSEGMILDIDSDQLKFNQINKFNFNESKHVTIKFRDIVGIEFGGSELRLLKHSIEFVTPENHIEPFTVEDKDDIIQYIGGLEQSGKLFTLETADDRKYFYVGSVVSQNANELVIRVVDMSGRFGGYVWLRYDDIKRLVLESDYLTILRNYVYDNWNSQHFTLQGLNAQRDFDDNDNILLNILSQAVHFHKVMRFELTGNQDLLGVPEVIYSKTGSVKIRLIDIDDDGLLTKEVGIETIKEVAFDYFKAFLLENHID